MLSTTTPSPRLKKPCMWLTIYESRRAKKSLTSEAGKEMQAEVWREMLQIFESAVPGVSKIAQSSTV
jgi:hypothetical protein